MQGCIVLYLSTVYCRGFNTIAKSVARAHHRPNHVKRHPGLEESNLRDTHYVGEAALRIPEHLVITLDRVFQDEAVAELLTTNKLSELACLTLYLMYEKKNGKDSFWYEYIKVCLTFSSLHQSSEECHTGSDLLYHFVLFSISRIAAFQFA